MFEIVRQGLSLVHSMLPSNVTIKEDLDKNTGMVFVDATQTQTVLMNLIANAVDSMDGETGDLNISLSRAFVDETPEKAIPGLEKGHYAKLTVADTGHGMDEKTLNRIFDPFFTTKEPDQGTGLGLSSAFGTIYKQGGTIRALSTLDVGTVFDVYLPLEQKD
jgi:signal transduction histidine kinase